MFKYLFIIPAEDKARKIAPGREKVLTLQKLVQVLKNIFQNKLTPDKFWVTKFHEI